MTPIISCDWGTSVLRVRLVDTNTIAILAEVKSLRGISQTFESWKNSGEGESGRLSFYQSVLKDQIKELEEKVHASMENVPVVISGMASSSIGIIEVPYKQIPFNISETNLNVKTIEGSNEFKHSMLIIPGISSADDVMRGEETQLAGCVHEVNKEEHLFIFPGTHSKHVVVKNETVLDFKTYMTGEFFDLLSSKSILSSSVKRGEGLDSELNRKSFDEGLQASSKSNLLHNSFLVRTNDLFKKFTQQQNYYYLSGIVIGAEVVEIPGNNLPVTLVASGEIGELYSVALNRILNGNDRFAIQDPDLALIKGQVKILRQQASLPSKGGFLDSYNS